MSNSQHDEFKLLAIRPLKGCAPQYIKILKEDTLYKFYNDYAFYNKDGKEVQDDEPVIE